MNAVSGLDIYLEIPARALEPGMFVAALDRPWEETPFALQGFNVQNRRDIEMVCRFCQTVRIDPARRVALAAPARSEARGGDRETSLELLPAEFTKAATADIETADRAIRKVFGQLERGGTLEVEAMRGAVDALVKRVLQDSHAVAALVRIRRHGQYLYDHSLCNAVWAAVLGKHLGLPAGDLGALALGASLVDVGMTRLSLDPMNKPGALSPAEMAEVRQHVDHSIKLVVDAGVDARCVDVVANHHERFDGSGYPSGLAGHDIPLLARIAGLVDAYDAMITPRPHAPSRTSFEAMQELWDGESTRFQRELVEQFIQAIGLFPTGALVELSSGEVGIVVSQNEARRLKPRVMLVLDAAKRRYRQLQVVDLSAQPPGQAELWIRAELHEGAHGVHPDEFFL
ncbi:MAG: hypothetical protein CMD39_13610 [Gammaproteobacteria bacterium]|nr:hypothetical protein [Gammaproteobacteria bacterium]|tara:strand:+ start:3854 stop:5053 length:1200 start_codon:yes stop_codon:yes gene_type:complete